MTTKEQIITEAFGELALAGYVWEISPEENQASLSTLYSLMAQWAATGRQIGFAFGSGSGSDITTDSGIALANKRAVVMTLARSIAATKGKTLPASFKADYKQAMEDLDQRLALQGIGRQQLKSGTPRGAGQKHWRTSNTPFVTRPDTSLLRQGDDGGLDITSLGQ